MNVVTPRLKTNLGKYLKNWKTFSAYKAKFDWVAEKTADMQDRLARAAAWNEGETEEFLNELWAINSFGWRLGEVMDANDHKAIRRAFAKLLKPAASGQAQIEAASIPMVDVATFNEALCLNHPDRFCIKNKRSTIGLCFYSDVGELTESDYDPNKVTGAEPYHSMAYDDFQALIDDVKAAFEMEAVAHWGANSAKIARAFITAYGYMLADQFLEAGYLEFKELMRGSHGRY